eukprot:2989051-Pyramimonas_sp.AAC.1
MSFGGHVEVLDELNICRLPRDGCAHPACQINITVASEYLLEQLVGVLRGTYLHSNIWQP